MGGKMEQNKISLNERTKEYFSRSKENIIQSHNKWISAINTFSDEDGQITITMDNTQIIHSINISEKFLVTSDKKEIIDRLTRSMNKALRQAGINAAKEMRHSVSPEEYNRIVACEKKEVKEQIELLSKNNTQAIQEIFTRKRAVVSEKGNVTVIIFGNRMIHSLTINEEIMTMKNKSIIEKELVETVNKAMQENIEEIQETVNRNEEEFYKTIIKE
jgi:DNA-binding protein YbaB